jgi:hypothetical protein
MIDRRIEPELRQLYAQTRNKMLQNATIAARIAALRANPPQRYTNVGRDDADVRDVFWYVDDGDGIGDQFFPALADKLWELDELRPAKPIKHVGWGGFGRLDQQLCAVIAGVSNLLLPPLAVERQPPAGALTRRPTALF